MELDSIEGAKLLIPDPDGMLTHVQMRRFAGCPICNLHLHSIVQRVGEIEAAGIREVVVFHSTIEELRRYQDELPFAVIADPTRELCRRFGVERSPRAVLDRRAVRVSLKVGRVFADEVRMRGAPEPLRPTGGRLGLPADFLVDARGIVLAAKYGEHAYDY